MGVVAVAEGMGQNNTLCTCDVRINNSIGLRGNAAVVAIGAKVAENMKKFRPTVAIVLPEDVAVDDTAAGGGVGEGGGFGFAAAAASATGGESSVAMLSVAERMERKRRADMATKLRALAVAEADAKREAAAAAAAGPGGGAGAVKAGAPVAVTGGGARGARAPPAARPCIDDPPDTRVLPLPVPAHSQALGLAPRVRSAALRALLGALAGGAVPTPAEQLAAQEAEAAEAARAAAVARREMLRAGLEEEEALPGGRRPPPPPPPLRAPTVFRTADGWLALDVPPTAPYRVLAVLVSLLLGPPPPAPPPLAAPAPPAAAAAAAAGAAPGSGGDGGMHNRMGGGVASPAPAPRNFIEAEERAAAAAHEAAQEAAAAEAAAVDAAFARRRYPPVRVASLRVSERGPRLIATHAAALAPAAAAARVLSLDVSHSAIGDEGAGTIGAALLSARGAVLRCLNLAGCGLSAAGITALALHVRCASALRVLALGYNAGGAAGAMAVLRAIAPGEEGAAACACAQRAAACELMRVCVCVGGRRRGGGEGVCIHRVPQSRAECVRRRRRGRSIARVCNATPSPPRSCVTPEPRGVVRTRRAAAAAARRPRSS